jgi:hypothetical protein
MERRIVETIDVDDDDDFPLLLLELEDELDEAFDELVKERGVDIFYEEGEKNYLYTSRYLKALKIFKFYNKKKL